MMARKCLVRVHKMSSLLDENDMLKCDMPCNTLQTIIKPYGIAIGYV